jgi:hypothetical protein
MVMHTQMSGPEFLRKIALAVNDGKPMSSNVRELLAYFGAQRRRVNNVAAIREALLACNLETKPDFESAYIDGEIEFVLRQPDEPGGDTNPTDANVSSPVSGTTEPKHESPDRALAPDPTYRVSRLKAANRAPISVKRDAPLTAVKTTKLRELSVRKLGCARHDPPIASKMCSTCLRDFRFSELQSGFHQAGRHNSSGCRASRHFDRLAFYLSARMVGRVAIFAVQPLAVAERRVEFRGLNSASRFTDFACILSLANCIARGVHYLLEGDEGRLNCAHTHGYGLNRANISCASCNRPRERDPCSRI